MPFLKTPCTVCGKTFESAREFTIGSTISLLGKCGHVMLKHQLDRKDPEAIISLDGRKLFPFQRDGVRAAEGSGGRILIADEMGLGKTVQALGTLALHNEMRPFMVIVKSSLKVQWQHEIMRWIGEDCFAQIVDDSSDVLIPGCCGYIISYDLIPRFNNCNGCSHGEQHHSESGCSKRNNKGTLCSCKAFKAKFCYDLPKVIEKMGIKTIILDECQQIKNTGANRTIFTRSACKEVPNVIALSGTPIKNNAAEYFPILNILRPEMFPTFSRFQYDWCDNYYDGYKYVTGGLRNAESFHAKTKDFIIRRERKDVLPDLPTIDRTFSFHDLGAAVEKEYIKTFKEFRDDYNSNGMNGFAESGNILAYLSKMRHLVGYSKIDPCIDFVMEFLGSTDRKLTIFVHHKDVGEILTGKLRTILTELDLDSPLQLTAEQDAYGRANTVQQFKDDARKRIMIASTLASGEGLNLQFCSDMIMLERQWNPANEEQAEGRFPRPGSTAQSIAAKYFVAVGTVDEFFSEIVERKRAIFANTMKGEKIQWEQSSLMKELAETLAMVGGKRWQI